MPRIKAVSLSLPIALAALLSPIQKLPAQDRITIQDVQRAWKQRSENIRTFRIEWDANYTVNKGAYPAKAMLLDTDEPVPPEPRTFQFSFGLIMEGDGKLRHHRDEVILGADPIEFFRQQYLWTIDGRVSKSLVPADERNHPRGGVAQAEVVERQEGIFVDDPFLFPVVWSVRPFGFLVTEFDSLTQHYRILPGREEVDSRSCVIMQGTPHQSSTRKFWLDPERDFAMRRFERLRDDATVSLEITIHQFENQGGVWVPLRWQSTGLKADGTMRTSTDATMTKSVINEPIDPATFDLHFPPGTWVEDHIAETEYIVRENGQKRIIQPHEKVAAVSYEDLLNTESGQALNARNETRSSQGWPAATWVLIATVVVLIVATSLVLWKRRRGSRV